MKCSIAKMQREGQTLISEESTTKEFENIAMGSNKI